MTVSVASSVPAPGKRGRGKGVFLLAPSYTRTAILYILLPSFLAFSSHRSTTYHHPRIPTTPASGTTTTATITTTIALSDQHIDTITGPREPLLEARKTIKEKKEVEDERETERGEGDYVGRRKRGDKEAKSNPRRDEQDGGTRRPRMRTE